MECILEKVGTDGRRDKLMRTGLNVELHARQTDVEISKNVTRRSYIYGIPYRILMEYTISEFQFVTIPNGLVAMISA
jgi:hypothetical protein